MKVPSLKKPKKSVIIIICVVCAALVIGLIAWRTIKKRNNPDMGMDDPGMMFDGDGMIVDSANMFSGVVEPEESQNVNADPERVIDQILVQKGDTVTAGQKLFTYKNEDMSLQIEQANLDIAGFENNIKDAQDRIAELTKEKANKDTTEERKIQITSEIQQQNTAIKQAELSKKSKLAEINSINKKLASSVVTAPIGGIITNINSSTGMSSDGSFMTIQSNSTYRIKGTVDEMNVGSLMVGTTVTIHSRVDDTTWTGTVTKVDTSTNVKQDANQMYGYGDSSSQDQASKYYFYASIDSAEGLIVGQHVYVEVSYDDMSFPGEGDEMMTEDGTDAEVTDDGAEG